MRIHIKSGKITARKSRLAGRVFNDKVNNNHTSTLTELGYLTARRGGFINGEN